MAMAFWTELNSHASCLIATGRACALRFLGIEPRETGESFHLFACALVPPRMTFLRLCLLQHSQSQPFTQHGWIAGRAVYYACPQVSASLSRAPGECCECGLRAGLGPGLDSLLCIQAINSTPPM
jgi:hypothetical protein